MNTTLHRLKYSIRHQTKWTVIHNAYKVSFYSLLDTLKEILESSIDLAKYITFALMVVFTLSIMPLWLIFSAIKYSIFNPDETDKWIEQLKKNKKEILKKKVCA